MVMGSIPKSRANSNGIAHRALAAFVTALEGPVGTVELFGTIGEKENLGFLYLSEGFQDGEKMMGLLFIEAVGKKVRLLKGFSDCLKEVAFLDPGNPGLPSLPEGVDDFFDMGRRGLRIFEEAFEIEDGPFGIGKKIARNQYLIDHARFRVQGDGYPDQPSRGLQDGRKGFSPG